MFSCDPVAALNLDRSPAEQRLTANEAVRVSGTADSQRLRMEAIPAGSRNYVRSLQDCVECCCAGLRVPHGPPGRRRFDRPLALSTRDARAHRLWPASELERYGFDSGSDGQ